MNIMIRFPIIIFFFAKPHNTSKSGIHIIIVLACKVILYPTRYCILSVIDIKFA